ncbi:MAG: DM13 domain-containing protein [Pseudomonadota bacterium]
MGRFIGFLITHGIALALGVAIGIYTLPILTAPPSPDADTLAAMADAAIFEAPIAEDLPGNDLLHWGRGTISITPTQIIHEGELAPGPDYRVYLVPEFVQHEDDFERVKTASLEVGPVNTFGGFVLDLPAGTNAAAFTTVLVWCEAFGEFIAAALYR